MYNLGRKYNYLPEIKPCPLDEKGIYQYNRSINISEGNYDISRP